MTFDQLHHLADVVAEHQAHLHLVVEVHGLQSSFGRPPIGREPWIGDGDAHDGGIEQDQQSLFLQTFKGESGGRPRTDQAADGIEEQILLRGESLLDQFSRIIDIRGEEEIERTAKLPELGVETARGAVTCLGGMIGMLDVKRLQHVGQSGPQVGRCCDGQ